MISRRSLPGQGLAMMALSALAIGMILRADDTAPHPTEASMDALASTLKWQTGTITLEHGLAKLNLSSDFRFLGNEDTQKVVHDIWGNPRVPTALGMIFPADSGPLDHGGWGMLINYEEGGYIKDDDAAKINYPELLKQMQKDVENENPERRSSGYPEYTLVGWATPPHYDAATHKLYWAQDLRFNGSRRDTLNYNIRVLGRHGVLVLNAIARMDRLAEVDAQMPQVLSMVDFQPGNLYSDFDPKVDKIATYGLATLIAGGALGAAAKVGAFKFMIPLLLFLKKFAILAVVAVATLFKKMTGKFSGKASSPTSSGKPSLPPQQRP